MPLTRLDFTRYKGFARRESLELRPLTILIGRNNSGKSAIARLPILLGYAFSERAMGPLELDAGGLDFGGSLLDLIHGRSSHGRIELGFRVDTASGWLDWSVVLQHYAEFKLLSIERLEVSTRDGGEVRLERTEGDPRPRQQVYGCDGKELTLEFEGLRPRGEGLPPVFDDAHSAAIAAFDPLRYLGPFRDAPRRSYLYPPRTPRDVGPFGGLAAEVLGADALRGDGRLLGGVTRVFEDMLGTGPVEVESYRDGGFSVVIRDRNTSAPINLVDTGVGLGQVLSLVVQRMLDETMERSGGVEVVEQPELHLHPQAHGAIADLYVDAVAAGSETRFIIETHAENVLLRIRRRVAEGRIRPEQVAVYWARDVEVDGSRLMPIHIDAEGDVDVWPAGVFSEDFDEAKALARARRRGPS